MNIRRTVSDISARRGRRRFLGRQAERPELEAAILGLLLERPRNGYQIIQELDRRSGGLWQPSPGSVYPALRALEGDGMVERPPAGGRRLFRLTERGLDQVERRRPELVAVWSAVGAMASSELVETGRLLDELAVAARQVAEGGNRRQGRAAREILRGARRALYALLASEEEASGGE